MSEAVLPPEIMPISAYDLTLDRYWAAQLAFKAESSSVIVPSFFGDIPESASYDFWYSAVKSSPDPISDKEAGNDKSIKALTLMGKSELGIFIGKTIELLQATEDENESFEHEVHGMLVWDRVDHAARVEAKEQLRYYDAIPVFHDIHVGMLALSDCAPEDIIRP